MRRSRELLSIYARIWRTYWRWAPSLLLLAVVVFIPLGAVHALTLEAHIGSFDLGGGLHLLAIFGAVLVLAVTGLVGEVFYTGAVSILLTHPRDGQAPSLREIAGMVKYGPLIAIDLVYGFAFAVGTILFVIPGALVFVWFGLAAPVVEIEHRGVRAAFRRSVELVRHKFWIVALVLIPIEIAIAEPNRKSKPELPKAAHRIASPSTSVTPNRSSSTVAAVPRKGITDAGKKAFTSAA